MNVAELRTFDHTRRPPGMGNWYCTRCSCRKSGDATEPNRRDEGCADETCLCHRDARCDCCDGPDGLGYYHFETVDQLRRFLDTPDHETTVDLDVAYIPGSEYGMVFVTAGEASAWLEEYLDELAEAFTETRVRMPAGLRGR